MHCGQSMGAKNMCLQKVQHNVAKKKHMFCLLQNILPQNAQCNTKKNTKDGVLVHGLNNTAPRYYEYDEMFVVPGNRVDLIVHCPGLNIVFFFVCAFSHKNVGNKRKIENKMKIKTKRKCKWRRNI